jgi:hypothetical protein
VENLLINKMHARDGIDRSLRVGGDCETRRPDCVIGVWPLSFTKLEVVKERDQSGRNNSS